MSRDEFNALFDELEVPGVPDATENEFAVRIRKMPGISGVWIGKDLRRRPAVLVSVEDDGGRTVPRIELSNFSYRPRARCLVRDDSGAESEQTLAVLLCLAEEESLHRWFLRTAGALVRGLASPITQAGLDAAVEHLVRLFVALGRTGSGTVQGLWGELLVLAHAQNPSFLLRAWHADPMEPQDFIAGAHRVEVKTVIGGRREHHFSLDQLSCSEGCRLAVVSIQLQPTPTGPSVADLVDAIEARVDGGLAPKLHEVVTETLGSDWRRALDQRYSGERALESLRVFDGAAVPQIPAAAVPPEVRNVRFIAELWGVATLSPSDVAGVGLWAALPLAR